MDFKENNKDFIKKILIKVGFEDNNAMPLLIDQTLAVFNDWLQGEILTALSDKQMEEFDKLMSGEPSDEQIYDFFSKSIKDFDSFMDGLYDKFEKTYMLEHKKALKNN